MPSLGLPVRGLLLASGLAVTALAQHPNLLLIVPDDLGVDSVGCYGMGTAPPTPVIDAVAHAGVRFTNAFVNPSCTPSRTAMLTGRYAFRSGSECTAALPLGAIGMAADAVTLAVPLNDAGYHTAMIGKWHLGNRFGDNTPNHYGWSHFEGLLDSGVSNPFQWTKVTNGVASPCSQYVLTNQVNSAIGWIQGQTGPWALALTLTLPHSPYHTPPANLHNRNLAGLSPTTTPRPFFEAMVQAMDTEIGRLLATLGPTVLANTNVVIIGDNGTDNVVSIGPNQPDHAKGSLYNGGSHVPLIISGPAVTAPGSVAAEIVAGPDLFPTILTMCGVGYPSAALASIALPLDGASFAAALAGQSGYGRNFVYSEVSGTPLGQGYTVRTANHRLVRYMLVKPQHEELFELATDPWQQNNLLANPLTPTNQLVLNDLLTKMETIRDDGWAELYGHGCASSAGVPLLRTQTQPRVGTVFYAAISHLSPQCTGILGVIGLSRNSSSGSALPFDLAVYGMPGCTLNTSIDFMRPFPLASGIAFILPIPAIPALYRAELYLQGIAVEPGANQAGLVWTQGLRCIVGR